MYIIVIRTAGSADQEVSIMLTSWESKANILQNTWTEFISKTIDTSWAKGILDAVTWLIEGFGDLGTAITIFGGALVALKWNNIVSGLKTFGSVIKQLPGLFKSADNGANAFDAGMKALNLSLTSTQLIVGGVVAILSALVIAFNHIQQAQEEARQASIDAGNAAVEEAKSIEELYGSYQDADKAYSDGTGSKKEFESATYDLLEAIGYEKDAIDEQITRYGSLKAAIDANKGAVTELLQAKIESSLYDAKAGTLAAGKKLSAASGKVGLAIGSSAETVLEYYNELVRRRNEMLDSGEEKTRQFDIISDKIVTLTPLVDEYNEAIENQTYLENLAEDAKDGVIESYERETDALHENTDAQDENADAASKNAEKIAEAAKTLKQQENDLETVSQALAEYQRTGRVSAETMKSLMGISSKYVKILIDENGKLNVTESSLIDVADAIFDDVEATEELAGVTKDSSSAMDSFVSGLIKAAKQAGATEDEVNGLVAQLIIFNNTGLDVRGKIAALQALALQAGVTQSAVAGVGVTYPGRVRDSEMTVSELQKKYDISAAEAEEYLAVQKKRQQSAEDQMLLDYWSKLEELIPESDTSSSSGGGSSSDANLEAHKSKVELLKSELTLMEKQGASEEEQKNKMRQIQQALHAQAEYLRAICL